MGGNFNNYSKKNHGSQFEDQGGGNSNMLRFNTILRFSINSVHKKKYTYFYIKMKINMNPNVVEKYINILYTCRDNNFIAHFFFLLVDIFFFS